MKNSEKWRRTQSIIFDLARESQTEMNLKELQNRITTRSTMMYKFRKPSQEEAKIAIKDVTLRLFTDDFGDYVEVMFKKRRRLNVVPMCFLVQLYNEQVSTKGEEAGGNLAVPFELRSFWKMQRAKELVGDLLKVMLEQKLLLQNLEDKCISEEQSRQIEEAMKMADSLKILPPEKGKIEIHFLESKFRINTKNVKLDIVPLCKLLVQYYAQFTICMDKTCEVFEQLRDKQEIYHVEGEMQRFMESYFTSGINCQYEE